MSEDMPLTVDKVSAGMKFYKDTVTLEIIEVNVVKGYRSDDTYIIAYRLRDGNFVSPVAHIFVKRGEDVRKHIELVIDNYLNNRNYIKSVLSG